MRASLTCGALEAADPLRRLSSLDHHCRLLAEYPCFSQNAAALLPLDRHAATRPAHSDADALVMPLSLSSQHPQSYTAP
jgi:hypothetical protein